MRLITVALMALALCLLPGCITDSEQTKEIKAKRGADGSEYRNETNAEAQTASSRSDREITVTVTNPAPIDPDLLPEAPERRPLAVAPAGKQPVANTPAASQRLPPAGQPQMLELVEAGLRGLLPIFPGAVYTLTIGSHQSQSSSSQKRRELTVDETWQAVRDVPMAVWCGVGAGVALGVLLLIFGGRWRLIGLPVIGAAVLSAMAIVLAYTQGVLLAWITGGLALVALLIGALMVWAYVRQYGQATLLGRAFGQTVQGVSKFFEAADSVVVAQAKASIGRKQDTDVQQLVKEYRNG